MTSASFSLPRMPWLRPKYFVFAFIALMLAYVLRHDEFFLIDPRHPKWQHVHPFPWYLLPHGIAGACALLLAPMQFSDRLRRSFAMLHRVVGLQCAGGGHRVAVPGIAAFAPPPAASQVSSRLKREEPSRPLTRAAVRESSFLVFLGFPQGSFAVHSFCTRDSCFSVAARNVLSQSVSSEK
jgi:hypothetical protein